MIHERVAFAKGRRLEPRSGLLKPSSQTATTGGRHDDVKKSPAKWAGLVCR